MKIQPIYNSNFLKKGLEFASERKALFVATASLVLSTAARPAAILSTPNTDKENKRYACIKSLASSAAGYLIMLGASLPVSKALKNIEKNPEKYLKKETIKTLQCGSKTLGESGKYKFVSKLFDLGLGFIIAVPKSTLTCLLIPPFMNKIFPDKKNKQISFTGNLTKSIGKMMDSNVVKKAADKYYDKNVNQHIICLTDILATTSFITQTARSKKIKEERKKALMYNAGISTGLCIGASYAADRLLKKPTERFIEKFKQANINSPKLDKYIDGINVAKPALILGVMYYIFIPLISTYLADRFDKNVQKNKAL